MVRALHCYPYMRSMTTCTILMAGTLGGAAQANTAPATETSLEPAPGRTAPQTADEAHTSGPPFKLAPAAPTERSPAGPGRSGEPAAGEDVRGERKPAFLTAADIAAEVTPYAPDIQRCYREINGDAPRASHVSLKLVIAPEGHLRSLEASSPGLSARTTRKIAACARTALETARFPARRNETIAIVPYYFQKTDAPNAGPQLSCWSAKGC